VGSALASTHRRHTPRALLAPPSRSSSSPSTFTANAVAFSFSLSFCSSLYDYEVHLRHLLKLLLPSPPSSPATPPPSPHFPFCQRFNSCEQLALLKKYCPSSTPITLPSIPSFSPGRMSTRRTALLKWLSSFVGESSLPPPQTLAALRDGVLLSYIIRQIAPGITCASRC
jgi:hypothetical protein